MVNLSSSIKKMSLSTGFFTLKASLPFTQLKKAFTKAPILCYFDSEHHIQFKIKASGYAIGGVPSQLTTKRGLANQVTYKTNNQLINPLSEICQWYPIAFFFWKMFPTETRYKTYDQKLLAIIESFKTWCHYLKSCKFEFLVLTNHNNFYKFIDRKSVSFC